MWYPTGSKHLAFFRRQNKYCLSADINCGINCVSPPDERVAAVCVVMSVYSVCSADDVAARRWVRGYWGSDEACNEGLWARQWPGIMEQVLCCASSGQPGCNAPGAAPPAVKCFQTSTTYTSGVCAGRSTSYSVCAVNQSRANEKALAVSKVRLDCDEMSSFRVYQAS